MKAFSDFRVLALVAALAVLVPLTASASETPGWYFDADVGGVWTSGNAESSALGAAAELRRVYDRWHFLGRGSASQTQTTTITRTATGTEDSFSVDENRETEKSAEFISLGTAAAYDVSEHFFLDGSLSWLRNRPSGIENRTLLALGAGNTWRDTDDSSFKTFYNFTYTYQEDVVENPGASKDFPGLRLGYLFEQKLTESTRLESDLVADWNLDNTDDIRVDWYNALPVSINSRLELKPALRLMWRNEPSLEELTLFDGGGVDTGNKVLSPLDELDTIFTLALVVKFQPDPEG